MRTRRSDPDHQNSNYADYQSDRSTVISKGAVLRSMQKDAIVERYLRRSFGPAWDEQYDKRVHGDVEAKLDAHDNVETAEKRIHWLFKFVCLVLCNAYSIRL